MLRTAFIIITLVHGLIHFMGFAKAFNYGNISQLTKEISRPVGVLWLATAVLFLIALALFLLKKDAWWMTGIVAVVLSQLLVVSAWTDAKWGTLANALIFIVCLLSFTGWRFEKSYERDVNQAMQTAKGESGVVTEAHLQHLPPPVQKYLRYAGVVGKPKVQCYKMVFDGQMREKGKDWFPFTSEQYNFTGEPTRLFFMKATMYGITVPGYHDYKDGCAGMHIKLFGLFPVVNESSGVLDGAETVTLFNDMCLFAPGSLIDKRIQWENVNDTFAKATFSVNGHTITAQLLFNEKGELTNFVSDDRTAIADKKKYRFSTPVRDYKNFGGYILPSYGEAVWHYSDGEFVYGRFHVKAVQYNPL